MTERKNGKKRILLLYPKLGIKTLKPQSPLALLSICPNLEKAGYEPVIIDARVEPDYEKKIEALLPGTLFVGITSMTGLQIQYALQLAEVVRRLDPDMPIVWGGIHATILPEQTLSDTRVDLVATGEGEELVVELADCLAAGGDLRTVKGIHFHDDNGEHVFTGPRPLLDMDRVPMPSWHLIDVSKYGEIGVQSGRGCPYGCRFCYNHLYNGRRWRAKNADAVLEELGLLKRKYGVDHVTFYDDNFFSNLKRVRYLAQQMIEREIDLRWSTTCRADILARAEGDFIDLIKRAGVHILFVGSESGSERILKEVINKEIDLDDILGMARNTRAYKLRVHTSFMAGFPDETEAERHLTFDMMDRVKAIDPDIYITTICIYTPYPGTPLYDEIVSTGLYQEPQSLEEWSRLTYFNCALPWLAPEDASRLENLAFIARFVFWHREIKERFLKAYQYPAYFFYRLDALLRWKLRFFGMAPEWKIFRRIVGQTEA